MPANPVNLKTNPIPALPAQPLSADTTVQWSLTTPFGISYGPFSVDNPFGGVWNSGHLNDVLLCTTNVPPGSKSPGPRALLVGADSGGVWSVGDPISVIPTNFDPNSPNPPAPTSSCLSNDWDTPGVVCLCAGPEPEHVYAGTSDVLQGAWKGYVYETVATNGVYSLSTWRRAPNATGDFTDFGGLWKILVIKGSPNRIVLAANSGVFWANIPAPGGNYAWQQVTKLADGKTFPPGAYSGLAPAPGGNVVVAALGVDYATGLYGIFYGNWSGSELTMTRATVPSSGPQSLTTFDQNMYRTTLCASPSDPSVIYAISAAIGSGIYAILVSSNGGENWIKPYDPSNLSQTAAPNVFTQAGAQMSGTLFTNAGGQGSYNQGLAVSPANVNTLAIGWQNGTYTSTDGGKNWKYLQVDGLHHDVHALYFDPADTSGHTLYICSDGGLAVTKDLGTTVDTTANQCLATLQLYSTTSLRDFYGTMSVSSPLMAAGSQDNGNLFCAIEGHYYTGIGLPQPAPSPWVQFRGGDGGPVAFLATTPPQQNFPDNPPQIAAALQILSGGTAGIAQSVQLQPSFMWNPGSTPTIPVRKPGQPDDQTGLKMLGEATRAAPKVTNAAGELMYAVVAPFSSLSVYGLFARADGSDINFEQIGSVSSRAQNDTISAVGTVDGTTVFVGTSSGRMFKFAVQPGTIVAAASVAVTLPSGVPQGAVQRIVALSASSAFATFNTGWSGRLLKYNGTAWTVSDSGLSGGAYFGLECDDAGNLFAAADDLVFISRDGGTTWKSCSSGLPKRPHCSDLRFARDSAGAGWLYLSTFGRSAWQANIYPAPTPSKPAKVAGATETTGTGR